MTPITNPVLTVEQVPTRVQGSGAFVARPKYDYPVIERSNQVYALDTTYVPMAHGFVYLTAVIDWASRRVLAHRVAITMEAEHAVAVLEEAFAKYGLPEIVNTDQGSHQYSLHRRGPLARNRFVDGWQGKLAGQRFYRTAVAQREVRRDIFEGL